MTGPRQCCAKPFPYQTCSTNYQNSHAHIVQEEMRGATMDPGRQSPPSPLSGTEPVF